MCAAIPIVGQIEVLISGAERARLKALAEKRSAAEPDLSSVARFGPRVETGVESAPALLVHDQSEIALSGSPEESLLEYRLALLADSDDMLVLSDSRCLDFENYLSGLLGIGMMDVLIARNPRPGQKYPMPRRCAEDGDVFRHISGVARRAGRLAIVPYIATGHVWDLAHRISEASGAAVLVAAPPPRLARQVNNKLWFAERVSEVLGQQAHPPSFAAFGPAALAARVRALSRQGERVMIKVPDSAGSAGNLVLAAEDLRDAHLPEVRQRMIRLIASLGSGWCFPLKVEVWESPVVSSPSVQIWIPHHRHGPPIVEGLFEQIVRGVRGAFVGATRAHLPGEWRERLAREATCLAILFQELGYFGRVSFDAVIAGERLGDAKLHWIECNGRWGGVSIPMTFSNRLGSAVSDAEIVIVQRTGLNVPPRRFRDVLSLCRDMLFTPGQANEGIIPLTPTGFERGSGVHFMTIAATVERAEDMAKRALARIRGR